MSYAHHFCSGHVYTYVSNGTFYIAEDDEGKQKKKLAELKNTAQNYTSWIEPERRIMSKEIHIVVHIMCVLERPTPKTNFLNVMCGR